jgi:RNA polymerase sigma factor (sigma-70 family)
MDERTIITQAGQGDPAAFEQLVSAHQKAVYRQMLDLTGEPEDAFDLTQKTFIKAWHAIPLFQFDCELSQWFSNIAQDTCKDFLKKHRRKNVRCQEPKGEPPAQLTQAIMNSIRREKEEFSPKQWLKKLKFTIFAAIVAAIILLAARFGGQESESGSQKQAVLQPSPSQIATELHPAN